MRWLVVIILGGCSMSSPCSNDCDWTWLEEEGCMMDTCELQLLDVERDHSWTECRDGECWCCTNPQGTRAQQARCWFSGRVFEPWSDGDS